MTQRIYHIDGSPPLPEQVFVFGSNMSGLHGGGAARVAHREYGAMWGIAEGSTGRCYAIPTVLRRISGPRPLPDIHVSVTAFLRHATVHSQTHFFVTRVGCGLAGYRDADIAPMFAGAPPNCSMPEPWRALLETAEALP